MLLDMTKFVVKMAYLSGKTVVFANLIRERRKKLGYDQRYMAKIMGTSVRTYQRKERGFMSISELEDICKVLGLSMVLIPNECIS
jgi:transcriptional regulator with XRE-family HTH domain